LTLYDSGGETSPILRVFDPLNMLWRSLLYCVKRKEDPQCPCVYGDCFGGVVRGDVGSFTISSSGGSNYQLT
jgi:hypothetical protein